ncbi:ribosomal protein S18-alanine N-acetyltransferase [Kitasatospora kazusensis]
MRWWDIEAVVELERRLFPEDAWTAGMYWSELAEARPGGTRHYTVATTEDGTVIGYAGLLVVTGEGDVQTIAVDDRHQGSGIGATLLTDLIAAAVRRDCEEMLLEVRVDNERARQLYERFGFETIGIRKGYYQPADVDALVMRRQGLQENGPPEDLRQDDAQQDRYDVKDTPHG